MQYSPYEAAGVVGATIRKGEGRLIAGGFIIVHRQLASYHVYISKFTFSSRTHSKLSAIAWLKEFGIAKNLTLFRTLPVVDQYI
jgi:hypothetical protein